VGSADDLAATVTLGDSASEPALVRGDEPWQTGDRIGRYRLIDRLGAGGMGVVFVADDPELDRRVALKLVRPEARSEPAIVAQVDLVVEAQAMAKLQHPNVVTVHDVGVDRGRVFVAMELVDGVTLRDWIAAERRPWRQVVTAFVGAARGLAAAHRAGLVHRDFKPDNVLIDRDGVARLADFGLARPPADHHERARAGSPPYMAPEQHDGAPVTEAADQFAFAAALWEAVFGALPFAGNDVAELAAAKRLGRIAPPPRGRAPAWLAAVLGRCLAPAPAQRFASLTALERALERGLGRRRRAVLATAVAVAAGAFAVGGLGASGVMVAPCGGAAGEIARTWNAEARDRVTGHLRGLGDYATGEAARLSGELARFADGWAGSHRAACLASARGELTAALYEQQLACLERSRMALEATLDVLAHVPRDRLSDAIVAARSLPDASRCRSEALVTGLPAPPPARAADAGQLASELERVRIRTLAREPDAGAAAAAAVTRAEALGHAPLVARAYLIDGLALRLRDDAGPAIDALDRAASTALGAGDDAAFVEAYARELFAIGSTEASRLPPRARDALGALPYVEQIALRLGAAAGFARPLLYNNAGLVRRSAGDNAGARAWFEKALAEPRTREGEIELAGAFGNLALVLDDPVRSRELLARERAILERLLGPDHVMTLDAALKASIFVAQPGAAAAALRPLCERYRRFHPTTAGSRIALCAYQLGWLAEERGDRAEARAELASIPADGGPQDRVGRAIRSYLADAPDQALREARDAIGRLQGQWWTQIYAVDALIVAAQADVRRGHPDDAIASLGQAVTLLDGLAAVEAGADRPRRLARVQAQLAILEATRDRPAAQRHAEAAVAWYRRVGGYDAQIAALAALAATADSH
jgi:tetratricopeptide (TPR) repeat protein